MRKFISSIAFIAGCILILGMGSKPQRIPIKDNPNVQDKGARNVRKNFTNSIGMTFVYIEPGAFMMGSPENEPVRKGNETLHKVTLSKGFYIQTTEVTQGQWKKVMASNPSYFSKCGDDCPVEKVSWNECIEFIKKLNNLEHHGKYRLPTEAEWEFTCRAGSSSPFSTGDCLTTDQANFDGNNPMAGCERESYRKKTLPAASFSANDWGLFDMHGSVWEWCEDRINDRELAKSAALGDEVVDPVCMEGGKRVIRGGSWISDASLCRSANRDGYNPGYKGYNIGFRLAMWP